MQLYRAMGILRPALASCNTRSASRWLSSTATPRQPQTEPEPAAASVPSLPPPPAYVLSYASAEAKNHTPHDVGRFFPLANLSTPLMAAALPREFRQRTTKVGHAAMLIRSQAVQAMEIIENANKQAQPSVPQILLEGKAGCGKSLILAHLLKRYHEMGWIIVHSPNTMQFSYDPLIWEPSAWRPNRLDLNLDALIWLDNFFSVNGDRVRDLKTTTITAWQSRTKPTMQAGVPLHELHQFVQSEDENMNAADVMGVVLNVVRDNTQLPVLVGIDEVNVLFEEYSRIPRPIGRIKHGRPVDEISILRHWRRLLMRKPPRQGAIVMAESNCFGKVKSRASPHSPQVQSIVVPDLTSLDATEFIDYYRQIGWLSKPSIRHDNVAVRNLYLLTRNNPRTLVKHIIDGDAFA